MQTGFDTLVVLSNVCSSVSVEGIYGYEALSFIRLVI
jgi:hypothetical protein